MAAAIMVADITVATMDTILIMAGMVADTAITGRVTAMAAADMAMEAAMDAAPDMVTGAMTTTAAGAVA